MAGEAAAADGFHFIQGLRPRHGNRLYVERLSVIDRRLLKHAFRLAALLRSRIKTDYHL